MIDLDCISDELWVPASKTMPILVKHVSALLSDLKMASHLFIKTLEGDQALLPNAFICLGATGEMWQQGEQNLFSKYDLTSCGEDGWWVAKPKSGNVVDALCVTYDLARSAGSLCLDREFLVRGLWGTKDEDGTFFQKGHIDDWVLRSRENPEDVWIVRSDIFKATYEVFYEKVDSL